MDKARKVTSSSNNQVFTQKAIVILVFNQK